MKDKAEVIDATGIIMAYFSDPDSWRVIVPAVLEEAAAVSGEFEKEGKELDTTLYEIVAKRMSMKYSNYVSANLFNTCRTKGTC